MLRPITPVPIQPRRVEAGEIVGMVIDASLTSSRVKGRVCCVDLVLLVPPYELRVATGLGHLAYHRSSGRRKISFKMIARRIPSGLAKMSVMGETSPGEMAVGLDSVSCWESGAARESEGRAPSGPG